MKNIFIGVLVVVAILLIGSFVVGSPTRNEIQMVDLNELHELTGSSWVWQYTNFSLIKPEVQARNNEFVLSFNPGEQMVLSATDCNTLSGTYVHGEPASFGVGEYTGGNIETLSFDTLTTTDISCEGSQDVLYAEHLSHTAGYAIDGDTLFLFLDHDFGVMNFRRL